MVAQTLSLVIVPICTHFGWYAAARMLRLSTCLSARLHTGLHTSIQMSMHVFIRMSKHMSMHMSQHRSDATKGVVLSGYFYGAPVLTHTRMRTWIDAHRIQSVLRSGRRVGVEAESTDIAGSHACLCACLHACLNARVCTHVCFRVQTHVETCACTHV